MLDFREMQHDALYQYLKRHVDGEVRVDAGSRRLYSTDASIYQIQPAGVVIPRTVEALATAVGVALEMRVPVTAWGGGTSLSRQSIRPGWNVECSKYLTYILEMA